MESRVGPDMTEVKSYLYPHNYLRQSVALIIGSSAWARMGPARAHEVCETISDICTSLDKKEKEAPVLSNHVLTYHLSALDCG